MRKSQFYFLAGHNFSTLQDSSSVKYNFYDLISEDFPSRLWQFLDNGHCNHGNTGLLVVTALHYCLIKPVIYQAVIQYYNIIPSTINANIILPLMKDYGGTEQMP